MINKIECIVDSLARINGASDPESEAYQLRNPLLLISFAKPGKHDTDDKGRRVFSSYINGYKAGVYDVTLKCSGKSRANVASDGTLSELLACYGIKHKAGVENIVNFIRRALKNQDIYPDTPISFFLDDKCPTI